MLWISTSSLVVLASLGKNQPVRSMLCISKRSAVAKRSCEALASDGLGNLGTYLFCDISDGCCAHVIKLVYKFLWCHPIEVRQVNENQYT